MCLPRILKGAMFITLIIPISVSAAEWSAEPSISLRTGYNDNIRLTAVPHDSVWETDLSPAVKFGVAKENQGLTGDAGFAIRRFTGGSGADSGSVLNREDYHLLSNAFHKTLRGSIKVNLDYIQDSTQDSELDETGNSVKDLATRDKLTLGPSWSRLLTELTRLDLTYQYSNVEYSDDPGANLVDYKYNVTSASLLHQFTPRIQGTLAAGYSNYKPDTDFDSSTVTLQVGLTTNISETLLASVLAGQRQTTSDSSIGTGFCIGAIPGATFPSCTGGIPVPTGTAKTQVDTSSPVYSASITRTLETGSLSAALSRTSSPGANGELLDRTRLVLSGVYKLTETFRSSLRIEYTENETIVNRAGFTPDQGKETFFRVTPRASWHWRREWELAGEYQYASNEDVNTNKATRNALYVTLTYWPARMAISR